MFSKCEELLANCSPTTANSNPTGHALMVLGDYVKQHDGSTEFAHAVLKKLNSNNVHQLINVCTTVKYIAGLTGTLERRNLQILREKINPLVTYDGKVDEIYGDTYNEKLRKAAAQALESIFQDGGVEISSRPRAMTDKKILYQKSISFEDYMDPKDRSWIGRQNTLTRTGSYIGESLSKWSNWLSGKDAKAPISKPPLTADYDTKGEAKSFDATVLWGGDLSHSTDKAVKGEEKIHLDKYINRKEMGPPLRRDLVGFIQTMPAGKVKTIAYMLDTQYLISETDWQVRLRALHFVHYFALNRSKSDVLRTLAEYFQQNTTSIKENCLNSSQRSLHDKALEVLSALFRPEEPEQPSSSEGLSETAD
jgi:hypothetical protein